MSHYTMHHLLIIVIILQIFSKLCSDTDFNCPLECGRYSESDRVGYKIFVMSNINFIFIFSKNVKFADWA